MYAPFIRESVLVFESLRQSSASSLVKRAVAQLIEVAVEDEMQSIVNAAPHRLSRSQHFTAAPSTTGTEVESLTRLSEGGREGGVGGVGGGGHTQTRQKGP